MSSFVPHGSNPQTSSFTCNTCGIKFVTAELQRQHMKTDWHRYNLKRRVAQLPYISSEVFAEKILISQKLAEDEPEVDEFGFYLSKRRTNNKGTKHLTKKHLRHQQKLDEIRGRGQQLIGENSLRSISPVSITSEFSQFSLDDLIQDNISVVETGSELNYTESDFTDLDDTIDTVEDELEAFESDDSLEDLQVIPITHCFFCGANNREPENNIKHMFNKHGLYIPERSYLTDLVGLLSYVSEIISIDHECLVCGFEGKNLESIRQHIHSKGHCKLPYETKEEKLAISEFYDFNVDSEALNKPKSNKKVAFSEESGEGIIVDVESDGSDDAYESSGINNNYSIVHIDRTGVEMTLPTGSKIGHRTMARYYRQNIALPRDYSQSQKTVALVDRRLAPGLSIRDITRQEKETRKLLQIAKNDYERRVKPSRINFQRHFRDEMLGPM